MVLVTTGPNYLGHIDTRDGAVSFANCPISAMHPELASAMDDRRSCRKDCSEPGPQLSRQVKYQCNAGGSPHWAQNLAMLCHDGSVGSPAFQCIGSARPGTHWISTAHAILLTLADVTQDTILDDGPDSNDSFNMHIFRWSTSAELTISEIAGCLGGGHDV
jgi:hypothetical protein